jgi:three-Cys-motif partner protein
MNNMAGAANKGHRFGGPWTTAKLKVVAGYLTSYTLALKGSSFQKAYIDAFAGTGYRDARVGVAPASQELLFPDLAATEPQAWLDGSARLALMTSPRFDKYIFIENSPQRCAHLEDLKREFPELARDVKIHQGEANAIIRGLCKKSWKSHRAVIFLDPYGLQVDWATIEAIAATRAIDMWLLFPLGIGVNRMLTKSGSIPSSWRRRLDLLLGTEQWYDEFYSVQSRQTLFGPDSTVVKASTATIGRYFHARLKSAFVEVAEPRVMSNSRNCPLYLLCFAVGNARGAPIGMRIANHLLRRM